MKLLTEFIGTFFLVLTIGMTVLEPFNSGILAPLAIAATLMVMVYAGGHLSGAHYNPAVSLAVFIRGRLQIGEMLFYWVAQMLAGIIAAYAVIFMKGDTAPLSSDPHILHVLLAEFLFTFALSYVVLNVATSKRTAGNSYFGVAIGGTILAGALSMGAVSGAAFNPSVALALCIMNLSAWSNLWAYVVANLAGALAAALVFKLGEESEV